jgi:large subunit ribosomal protein L29
MKDRENSASELRQMSDDQLGASLREASTKLFKLRVQAQTDRLDVPTEVRRNRRLIARIKTIQSQRASAATAKTGGKK